MRKLLIAIVALVALGWSQNASAVVQTTDVAFKSMGMATGEGTAVLEFSQPATPSAPKHVVFRVRVKISKTSHAKVRTDSMTVQRGTGETVSGTLILEDGTTITFTDLPADTTFFVGIIDAGGGGGFPGMPQYGGGFFPSMPSPGGPTGFYLSSRSGFVNARTTFIETDAVNNSVQSNTDHFNTHGSRGGGAGYTGLPPFLLPLVPTVSFDFDDQSLTGGGGALSEEIKWMISAGADVTVFDYGNGSVFFVSAGAAWVRKEFSIVFLPLTSNFSRTELGPYVGAGVKVVNPFFPSTLLEFSYQHDFLPDVKISRPAAAPGSNYNFQEGIDQWTFSVIVPLSNLMSRMR